MLTNNLLCPITFDTLGAGIPIGDDAFCIQHENGVIRHTSDEKPETTLALAQALDGVSQLSGSLFDAVLERFVEPDAHLIDLFGGGKINQHISRTNQAPR